MLSFQFAASKKYSWEKQTIASCVISFLLMTICGIAAHDFKWFEGVFPQVAASTIIAFLTGVIGALIMRSDWYDGICTRMFGVSPRSDVMESTLDVKGGSNVRVFFKTGVGFHVYGHYGGRDSSGEAQWLCITEPRLYMNGGEERQLDPDVAYLCRLSDIDHIIVE